MARQGNSIVGDGVTRLNQEEAEVYVYIKSEPGLWTVGFFNPETSEWVSESDHGTSRDAARRVSFLNGGVFYEPETSPRDRVIGRVCPNCGFIS